jgi:hypothetical protein
MGEAIDESLSHLKSGDIAAMVTYLRSVPMAPASDLPEPKASPAPACRRAAIRTGAILRGKQVLRGCLRRMPRLDRDQSGLPFATLTGTRSVNDPAGTNVAQVIIAGAQRHYAVDSTICRPSAAPIRTRRSRAWPIT